MRYMVCVLAVLTMVGLACAEIVFTESFEGPGSIKWQKSWGPAERTQDRAHDGEWAIKETLEDVHGLSVWYTEFRAQPNTTYKATAWVYIPGDQKVKAAALNFTRRNWNSVASTKTDVTDEWVKLETVYENRSEPTLRLQMFQFGAHAPGLGGTVMYWDDVTLEREMGETSVEDGIRINPNVIEGLDVTPAGGMKVTVAPGKMYVEGSEVEVKQETVLEVRPARLLQIRDEQARLTDEVPQSYGKGTPLRECVGTGTSVAGCLDPDSLVIKLEAGQDGARAVEGADWRADKAWGRVGRIEGGGIAADTTVFMDYDVSLLRIDTIMVRSDGTVVLREGNEHKMLPEAPRRDHYAEPLCNVFVTFRCAEITPELVYPVGPAFPEPTQAEFARNSALIPKTIQRLNDGEDFTILFWGDSVTCGGEASSQEMAFPLYFTNWLRCKYPQANIKYVNAGTGGWNSNSKLPLFEEEVMAHEPDLMVIEFVNDMGMNRDMIFANYTDAISRVREIGGEVIILTPHFTRPDWMGAGGNMRTAETRDAVTYLKEFAAENNVGLADASRRWEHLWIEGIPYLTLLRNAINHPDDRGHRLFVEELQKFFP